MEGHSKPLNKRIHLFSIAFILFAVSTHASDMQAFRIRMHQSITQDFTPADVAEEIRLGKKIAARLLGIEKLNSDTGLARYIALVGNSLALHSPRNELDYYFAVLDSDEANAYSTPGGYIFITMGALALVEDESELAAILAHEIAHITERHVVKELGITASEQSQLSGFARFLGSSGSAAQVAFRQAIDKAVEMIYRTGYKIRDELQADRDAVLLLAQAGYDPLALKRYLVRAEKMAKDRSERSTTHPAPAARFSKLDELIRTEQLAELRLATAKRRFNENVKPKMKSP